MTPEAWIMLAALVASIAVNLIGGTWILSASKQEILDKIREDRDIDVRAFGETIAALKQKINDVELESYKAFVRRDSFQEMIRQMTDATNARFDKVDVKLDRLFERHGDKPVTR